jgi:hypothetical protein
MAVVPLHVVQPVGDDHALGEAGEVMVERLDDPLVEMIVQKSPPRGEMIV